MSPNPRRTYRLAAAAIGLTVVLGACGGSSGSSSSPSSGSPDGRPATTSADKGSDQATGTPLEQLLGGSGASQAAVEDGVAKCMRDRGWQYTPNRSSMSVALTAIGGGDPKFVEQYGYGISTQAPFGTAVTSGGQGDGADTGTPKDPNAAYVQSLSSADQERYNNDLFGAPVGDNAGSDGAAIQMDPNSCFTKGQAEAAKTHPELSEEFSNRLGELLQGLRNDPRMQDATKKWSACMAKANFTYDNMDDIFTDLSSRYGQLTGTGSPGDGGSGGALMVPGGGAAQGAAPNTTLSPANQEALKKLQDEERAIAKADTECQKDTLKKVQPEVEKEIVEKLRSEFPGLGSGK